MAPSARRFVSLFSGAGGLDCGLESAGWVPISQIECAHHAAETLRLAAKRQIGIRGDETGVLESRIENVDPVDLRTSLGLEQGELPLLAGGPPCQPFTTHGRRQSIQDRRAESVWPAYLSYVEAFEPAALLIENVDGLLSAALRHRPLLERGRSSPPLNEDERKGSFLRWLVQELAQRGYSLSWGVAEAADYGAPQLRQRAILIGVRGENACFLPEAIYGTSPDKPFKTLKEALSGVAEIGPIQPLSEAKRAVYQHISPGGNWRSLPIEMQRATMGAAHVAEGGKSGWWRRLAWDAPAPTILGMPDHSSTALIHPDELRCLSVNECAAIQTFPVDYRFAGPPRSQYQQIGDAVPPLLGAALGKSIMTFLDGDIPTVPLEAKWRRQSANRRIGTHGWARRRSTGQVEYHLNSKVRDDHVWSDIVRVPKVERRISRDRR